MDQLAGNLVTFGSVLIEKFFSLNYLNDNIHDDILKKFLVTNIYIFIVQVNIKSVLIISRPYLMLFYQRNALSFYSQNIMQKLMSLRGIRYTALSYFSLIYHFFVLFQ